MEITLEEQKKARKPIKLATKSEHAAYFMPMLESFADHGELNEVVKNCVGKACDLLDSGIPLYPNDFKRTHEAGVVHAEYEAYGEEELENLDVEFALAGRMMSSRSFGKVIFFHVMDRTGLPLIGIVPDDPNVTLAAAFGTPLLRHCDKGAAKACRAIAQRLQGMAVPISLK